MNPNDIALPIIITNPYVPLNELVLSAAKAGALAGYQHENWPGRRKTVRLKNSKTSTQKLHQEGFTYGNDIAVASKPLPYKNFPPVARRSQVTGWEDKVLPQDWESILYASQPYPRVLINKHLGMTPGKMCAQAAHILELALRTKVLHPKELDTVGFGWFDEKTLTKPLLTIKDEGHTEVPAGSLTAVLL